MLQSLSLLPLESLAKASGFVLRRPRKLSLEAFLQSILLSLCQPSYSLGAWAAQLSALQAGLFSKQPDAPERIYHRRRATLDLTIGPAEADQAGARPYLRRCAGTPRKRIRFNRFNLIRTKAFLSVLFWNASWTGVRAVLSCAQQCGGNGERNWSPKQGS